MDDQRMLQLMGRENGEDYSAQFLVMLNTWEGAVKFLDNSRRNRVSEAAASEILPLRIASLLGWTTFYKREHRMSAVATACNAAYALIRGGYMTRDDLIGLSVRDARDVVVRAQERMEQLEKIAHREKHDQRQADNAKEVIGKAARITAQQSREGRIPHRQLRTEVDLNTLRVSGAEKVRAAPLIVEALDDRKMLQFMGRENGEDYSANFLVMLNTWEGAREFVAKSMLKEKMRNNFRTSPEPIEIARLLGWTERSHETGDRLTYVASACHAAHALIVGGYMSRDDLARLSANSARAVGAVRPASKGRGSFRPAARQA